MTAKKLVEFEIETKFAEKGHGFLPMQGWHPNYIEFKVNDKTKGSVTFINNVITVITDGKKSTSVNLIPLIEAILKEQGHGS